LVCEYFASKFGCKKTSKIVVGKNVFRKSFSAKWRFEKNRYPLLFLAVGRLIATPDERPGY
jgi:hypothetical protein